MPWSSLPRGPRLSCRRTLGREGRAVDAGQRSPRAGGLCKTLGICPEAPYLQQETLGSPHIRPEDGLERLGGGMERAAQITPLLQPLRCHR